NQQGEIIGAMLGIESLQPLLDALKPTVKENLGLTQLVQTMPKTKGTPFVTTGNKSKALEVVELKLEPARWTLRFTGSKTLLKSAEPSYESFALFAAVLAIATLIIIYLLVRVTLHFHVDKAPSPRAEKKRRLNAPATDPVNDSGESFLDVIPGKGTADTSAQEQKDIPEVTGSYPDVVFRDYDIRGIAGKQLTVDFAQQLGKALALRAIARGEHTLILGRDGRQSSEQLSEALEQGILSTGCHIIHLGLVPTPLLNFATHHLQQSDCGVMVTASHNPAEYNGFKMFFQHHAMCGEEVKSLRQEMSAEIPEKTPGERSEQDLSAAYLEAIVSDIVPAQGLKVILDAGNGSAGELAIRLLEAIGCDVLPLYCDVDGTFPNHPPDPSVPANLDDLKLWVKEQNADLGIALDGDGDRIVAVSSSGQIIWPDELLMIFARDVVSRHPGADVVFDIKSTRRLNSLISSYGGRPVMWKTGHSHMYNKIIESKAPLGGEFSGHIFFHDRWHGFDDGLYAAARLIEIMSIREQGLDDIMASFETRFATPEILVPVDENSKFEIIKKLLAKEVFQDGKVSTIDGLRVDFPKAWGLVRASNTSPALTLRFEAESSDALEKIQSLFREQLRSIDSNLTF
ncbi:MAG: phosphomannomutase/phosphoglucomutase, partial [Gammaproteobacteria bacterium]